MYQQVDQCTRPARPLRVSNNLLPVITLKIVESSEVQEQNTWKQISKCCVYLCALFKSNFSFRKFFIDWTAFMSFNNEKLHLV